LLFTKQKNKNNKNETKKETQNPLLKFFLSLSLFYKKEKEKKDRRTMIKILLKKFDTFILLE